MLESVIGMSPISTKRYNVFVYWDDDKHILIEQTLFNAE